MPSINQKLSEESIQKMRQTKMAQMLAKYNWKIVEPYLDTKLDLSSRNRTNEYFTLRQFKEKIESGSSVVQIQKETSKNLIVFYSFFAQGKITISKEAFEKEYESGKPLEQIAEENNIPFDYIGYLRQLYEIKVKGPKFINRKNTEIPLTQRQKEIVYGSLLGDAKRMAPSSVGFGQCEEQEVYLKWKYKEMESVASKDSLKRYVAYDKRYDHENVSWRFYTTANTDVESIITEFYKSGAKKVSEDIIRNLTPLSLAVWYMDDGKTDWSYNRREENPHWNWKPELIFCTDSFSLSSMELLVAFFVEKYNIKCHYRKNGINKDGVNRYRIIIDGESANDFIALIRPHVIPEMMYKVDYDSYLKWRK